MTLTPPASRLEVARADGAGLHRWQRGAEARGAEAAALLRRLEQAPGTRRQPVKIGP